MRVALNDGVGAGNSWFAKAIILLTTTTKTKRVGRAGAGRLDTLKYAVTVPSSPDDI